MKNNYLHSRLAGFKMKSGLLTFLFFLSAFISSAQSYFQRTYGNPSYGHPRMLRITSDGGYVMAGTMYNFTDNDAYVLKTDPAGNVQWSKTFGGSGSGKDEYAYDIRQTSDGGYIVTGRTNMLDVNNDVYLFKLDANGVLQWSKTFGCVNTDWGDAVLQTTDGGYLLSGQTFCSSSLGNAYVIKTDSSGTMQWTYTYGGTGTDEEFYDIQATSDSGYIMTGWTTSFGAGAYDVFLVKITSSGTLQWSKTFGGVGNDFGTRVRQNATGGFVISGYTDGFGLGSNDMYLLKTDSTGTLLWSKTFGNSLGELAFDLQLTSDGGIMLSGYSYITSTDRQACLVKTDAAGIIEWAMQYGDSLDENALSAKQNSNGEYVIGAYSTSFAWNPHIYLIRTDANGISGCNEGPIVLTATSPATSESSPTFSLSTMNSSNVPPTVENNLALLDNMLCTTLGNKEKENDFHFDLFPNPGSGIFTINSSHDISQIEIFDIMGKNILMKALNTKNETFNLSAYAKGLYLIKVKIGQKNYSKKIIIQ